MESRDSFAKQSINDEAQYFAAVWFSVVLRAGVGFWANAGTGKAGAAARNCAKLTTSVLSVLDKGGEVIELQLPATTPVTEVFQISITDIQAGSFIGIAALPQADGTQIAIAVTVFPETARGVGEGHRPFDLLPNSTMTNATVAEMVANATGRALHVKFKDGEKTVVVPKDVPVVTYKPGDCSVLVPGASVSISAQIVDEKPTAVRINAARDGFKLPY